jgi:hypothetical protein
VKFTESKYVPTLLTLPSSFFFLWLNTWLMHAPLGWLAGWQIASGCLVSSRIFATVAKFSLCYLAFGLRDFVSYLPEGAWHIAEHGWIPAFLIWQVGVLCLPGRWARAASYTFILPIPCLPTLPFPPPSIVKCQYNASQACSVRSSASCPFSAIIIQDEGEQDGEHATLRLGAESGWAWRVCDGQ